MERMSLEERLDELQAKEEIRACLHNYVHAMDKRDEELFMDLWEEDAVLSLGQFGESRGHTEIRQNLHQIWTNTPKTYHLSVNAVITVNGDWAEAISNSYATSYDAEGRVLLAFATYRDKLSRRTGKWRFVERRLSLAFFAPVKELYQL